MPKVLLELKEAATRASSVGSVVVRVKHLLVAGEGVEASLHHPLRLVHELSHHLHLRLHNIAEVRGLRLQVLDVDLRQSLELRGLLHDLLVERLSSTLRELLGVGEANDGPRVVEDAGRRHQVAKGWTAPGLVQTGTSGYFFRVFCKGDYPGWAYSADAGTYQGVTMKEWEVDSSFGNAGKFKVTFKVSS